MILLGVIVHLPTKKHVLRNLTAQCRSYLTMNNKSEQNIFFFASPRKSPGEDRPDDRGGGAGPVHQIQGDLPQSAHPAGARGASEDLWSV